MISVRGIIDAAITARGDGAETALARKIAERLGNGRSMENVRSQISRFRKGKRADGGRASLPLPMLEIILDELSIDLVPRS